MAFTKHCGATATGAWRLDDSQATTLAGAIATLFIDMSMPARRSRRRPGRPVGARPRHGQRRYHPGPQRVEPRGSPTGSTAPRPALARRDGWRLGKPATETPDPPPPGRHGAIRARYARSLSSRCRAGPESRPLSAARRANACRRPTRPPTGHPRPPPGPAGARGRSSRDPAPGPPGRAPHHGATPPHTILSAIVPPPRVGPAAAPYR